MTIKWYNSFISVKTQTNGHNITKTCRIELLNIKVIIYLFKATLQIIYRNEERC